MDDGQDQADASCEARACPHDARPCVRKLGVHGSRRRRVGLAYRPSRSAWPTRGSTLAFIRMVNGRRARRRTSSPSQRSSHERISPSSSRRYRLLRRARPELELVVVGSPGWGAQPRLDVPGVSALGFVDDDELACLYRGAAAFAFPSLFEGFGIPVAEAMACATPTVVSAHASLDEVSGGAALRADPGSPAAFAEALARGSGLALGARQTRDSYRPRALRERRALRPCSPAIEAPSDRLLRMEAPSDRELVVGMDVSPLRQTAGGTSRHIECLIAGARGNRSRSHQGVLLRRSRPRLGGLSRPRLVPRCPSASRAGRSCRRAPLSDVPRARALGGSPGRNHPRSGCASAPIRVQQMDPELQPFDARPDLEGSERDHRRVGVHPDRGHRRARSPGREDLRHPERRRPPVLGSGTGCRWRLRARGLGPRATQEPPGGSSRASSRPSSQAVSSGWSGLVAGAMCTSMAGACGGSGRCRQRRSRRCIAVRAASHTSPCTRDSGCRSSRQWPAVRQSSPRGPRHYSRSGVAFLSPLTRSTPPRSQQGSSERAEARAKLGARGIERARHFGWEKVAGATLDVYRSVVR